MEAAQLPPKPLLCINCEHYTTRPLRFDEDSNVVAQCSAPQNFSSWNMVDGSGQFFYKSCLDARWGKHGADLSSEVCDKCGLEAKWFVLRKHKQSATTAAEAAPGRKSSSKVSIDDIV